VSEIAGRVGDVVCESPSRAKPCATWRGRHRRADLIDGDDAQRALGAGTLRVLKEGWIGGGHGGGTDRPVYPQWTVRRARR